METAVQTPEATEVAKTETVEIPSHIKLEGVAGGYNKEQMEQKAKAYWESNPKTETKEVAAEVVVESEPVVEATIEAVKEPVIEATDNPFAEFGDYSSKDAISNLIKEHDNLRKEKESWESKQKEVLSAFEEFEKDKAILVKAKSPFANDTIRGFNNFVSKTGIDDFSIYSKFNSAKDGVADPIDVIAMQSIIDSPELSKIKGGYSAVYRNTLRELGLDTDVVYSDLTEQEKEIVDFKAAKAKKSLSEKINEFAKDEDFFSSLQAENEMTQKTINERSTKWKPEISKIKAELKSGNFTIKSDKHGELKLSVAVSEGDLDKVLTAYNGFIGGNEPDAANVEKLATLTKMSLMTPQNVQSLVEQALDLQKSTLEAKIKEELLKAQHNGKDPFVERKDAPKSSPSFAEYLEKRKG